MPIVLAAVVAATLGNVSHARADEDDEHPIVSTAAQISHNAAGQVVIAIRPAAQKRSGLSAELLKPVRRRVEARAYGFVLDPGPLSTLNSELATARAALDRSRAQYHRTRHLYAEHRNASQRDLQSAQASYLTDNSRFEALKQQLRDQWGSKIAELSSQARSQLVDALIERHQAIARVTVPIGKPVADDPAIAKVVVLGHERQPLGARAVYSAPTVEQKIQGQSFLLLLATRKFLVRPGIAVSAYLPLSRQTELGVIVPRSAVLRYAGKDWVYQELSGNRFVRRKIMPAEISEEGYFVTDLAPGTRVVIAGAQALLSQELKAQIRVED